MGPRLRRDHLARGQRSHQLSRSAVVVGAGIFGAGTADALARRGWEVTLVERDEPGNATSTSGDATRLLRFGHGPLDRDGWYTRSAWRAREGWRELGAEMGEELFVETGVVWFARAGSQFEDISERTMRDAGISSERLDPAALAALYPSLNVDDLAFGLLERAAGVIRVADGARALARRAVANGARLIRARARPDEDGSPVFADDERLEADRVVWACGPWLAGLFGDRVPIRVTKQDVFYWAVDDPAWAIDRVPAWIEDGGSDTYGHGVLPGRGLKLLTDAAGPPFDPDLDARAVGDDTRAEARAALGARFPALAGAEVAHSTVCQYELTPDRHFVIAPLDAAGSAWVVGGGSGHGAKHGPSLGAYVADLLEGAQAPQPRFGLARGAVA